MRNAGKILICTCLLAGCNWSRLVEFQAQMRAVTEYTAWQMESGVPVFVFKQPLLMLSDLHEFGLFPTVIDERNAVLRYRRVDEPQSELGEYDIRLLLDNGRLAGLIIPAKLREGLGRENIRRFFAMIGDFNAPDAGLLPVARTQLIAGGLFAGTAETLGREVVIDLEPLDPRNRPILLRLAESAEPGRYSSFHLNLKRRDRR